MSPKEKDKIQKYLWSISKHKGSIFDARVTQEMANRFSMKSEDVHEILIYYMAASRLREELRNSTKVEGKPRKSPVLQYHVSEAKAQETELPIDVTTEEEGKEDLYLMISGGSDLEQGEASCPFRVRSSATLNQLKVDFALQGLRELGLPFLFPKNLDIFSNGELVQDVSQLCDGNVLIAQRHFDEVGPQWFSELSQQERQKYFAIFISGNQAKLPTASFKQKYITELNVKFNVDEGRCLEIWEHFSQQSSQQHLEFVDQISLDGISAESNWLKMLSNDTYGRDFALLLGNIVVGNTNDKRGTICMLEENGLTRDKAVQAFEHFSQSCKGELM